MKQGREEIVAWVGGQVLPHEADVRAWLRRRLPGEHAVDDVVQEAYCRIARLDCVLHIESGRAYLFRTVANVLRDQLRQARIVRIDSIADVDVLDVVGDDPSPERIVSGRSDLERVRRLIADLPEKCRLVFELRRIHGFSQRQVAERLGVTENVVESQSVRGLRLVLEALAQCEDDTSSSRLRSYGKSRDSTRAR